MAYETLIVIDRGPVRTITVNRPDVLNALNRKVLSELDAAMHECAKGADIRAVVLTGAGDKSFVAGADIAEMKTISPAEAEEMSRYGHNVMERIENLSVPVIAAVNGFALGGGLELALCCDFIYASENARLGLVEANLALVPGFGGLARLTRRVGVAMARELVFTASVIKPEEAHRIGLVNKVFPAGEVVDAAVKCGNTIAEKGPYAVATAKRLLVQGQDADQRSANCLEQQAFGLVFGTEDHNEGIGAFLEKRKPTFTGR